MSSLEQTFKEIEFLTEPKPTEPILRTILLCHAINVNKGLKHNGLKEEDQVVEWSGISEGWDKDEGGNQFIQIISEGIYSLRYSNQENELVQFKFVTQTNSTWLSINAIQLKDDSNLYSFQIDTSKFNFNDLNMICKSQWINQYFKTIIEPLTKKKQQPQQFMQEEKEVRQEKPTGLFWQKPRNDLYSNQGYGRKDLDPFNNPFNIGGVQGNPLQVGGSGRYGTGGNLFGPGQFNQQQFQPPFQPPGARFDPFGPEPDINASFPPQWDGLPHQKKPGFGPQGGFGGGLGNSGGFFK